MLAYAMATLNEDLAQSRAHEIQTYLRSLEAMYTNAMAQNEELYRIAVNLTDDFQTITGTAVLEDSRIIKILRYAIAPTISQMKLGQFFGMKSIKKFEKDRLARGGQKYKGLAEIADEIAAFASDRLDTDRFRWLEADHGLSDIALAKEYAKKWTCSLAADQNAQTRYRNWRKDLQEHAIADTLVNLGYTKSGHTGIIKRKTDIKIGEFTTERRVKGRTRQKADVVVRSKRAGHGLVLIEAKAVGVELDSTKRIKECSDKSRDWASSASLDNPTVVAVIAGFFNANGISSLRSANITVVWEHRLADLGEIV